MRDIEERNILDEFCTHFCSLVEQHCTYIIVSGFVAISSGRTRATEDIDMIIERMPAKTFSALHAALIEAGFSCIQSANPKEISSYLQDNIPVRYTYKDRPLPEMEIKFAKDKLDEYQLQTRCKLALTGLDIWFSNIATNIAFKEELLKSEKDMKERNIYEKCILRQAKKISTT